MLKVAILPKLILFVMFRNMRIVHMINHHLDLESLVSDRYLLIHLFIRFFVHNNLVLILQT